MMTADDEHTDHGDDECFDLSDEFKGVEDNLNDARLKFLEASKSFDNDGKRFTAIVKEQLERLQKPDRAQAIKVGAATAISDINDFSRTHALLSEQVANLLIALNLKITNVQLKIMADSWDAFTLPAATSPLEAVHKWLENLSAQQRENVVTATSAILLGHRVAEAVRAVTRPIVMRQATLQQAAHDLAPQKVPAPKGIDELIPEDVVGEVRWALLEEILKQTVLETATHIPLAGLVVSIGKVASDVRARQVALKKRYESEQRRQDAQFVPGPIDVMFNLPTQLRDEDQITEAGVALTRQLFTVLSDLGYTKKAGDGDAVV